MISGVHPIVSILLVLGFLLVGLSIFYVILVLYPHKKTDASPQLSLTGTEAEILVPVLATFSGTHPLIPWSKYGVIARNNFNPSVTLTQDSFTFTVLSQRTELYTNIEHVDVANKRYTNNIIITFKDNSARLIFNVLRQENQIEVLRFLYSHNISLTADALTLLQGSTN